MKKFLKLILVLILCGASFLLGWRLMPKYWPTIKQNVYYKVFPTAVPEPTPVPSYAYIPVGTAALSDPVAPTDSLIYYLYRPDCGTCISMRSFIEGLPEQVVLPDGTISAVKLIPLNSRDEAQRPTVLAAFAAYGVAENDQQVPAILIGEKCIMLPADIYQHFYAALLNGEGLNTPMIDGGTRTE